MNAITKALTENADEKFSVFQSKIIPDTKLKILGVKTPVMRNIAKQNFKNDFAFDFLSEKHVYLEECFVHGFLIANFKDFDKSITEIEKFLPLVDNWAVCDCVCASMKIFKKNKEQLKKYIPIWLESDNTYTVRFAIVTLLDYYIDDADYVLNLTKKINSGIYYIDMALAWLYSVMLIRHSEKIIDLLKSKTLSPFIQNKTIRKARESFRIDSETKKFIKELKIKE